MMLLSKFANRHCFVTSDQVNVRALVLATGKMPEYGAVMKNFLLQVEVRELRRASA